MATTTSTPQAILDAVGGAENITHLTHCATRLRFELKDASVVDKDTVEKIPGVMGAVPQSGDRYQIIIGGAVQSVYNDIMKLPAMAGSASSSAKSDADVKAAARAKARGKNAYVDAFFEYLSDAFRPLLPVLLGASLILALIAVLEAFGVVDTHAKVLPSWLVFTNTMWRSVFYFLPAMVAYNAAKKLDIDPWVGAAVVLALLTPEYTSLKTLKETHCIKSSVGSDLCTTDIFGLPMKWSDYGGQVFLPLIMVPILALVYRGLKKVIPANVQMVFVPFFSFLVMIPVSAFLIGPFSLWLGNSIGSGLSWLNTTALQAHLPADADRLCRWWSDHWCNLLDLRFARADQYLRIHLAADHPGLPPHRYLRDLHRCGLLRLCLHGCHLRLPEQGRKGCC